MKRQEGFIEVPGGKVWYRLCGEGDLTPFIAIHGGPGANSNLQHVFEAFADQRPVLYYDQLGGTGKSDTPQDTSLYTVERSVEELHAIRKALKLKQVHLHGQSYGTIVATSYALKYPDEGVRSVILSSPAINLSLVEDEMNRLAQLLPSPHKENILNNAAAKAKTPEYIDAFIEFQRRHFIDRPEILAGIRETLENDDENIVKKTMFGRIGLRSHGPLRSLNLTSQLPDIKAPLLFACGRHEHCSPSVTSQAHSVVKESGFHIFEQSAHFPQLSETEKYLACIKSFIEKND